MSEQYGSLREKIAAEKAERNTRYAEYEDLYRRAKAAGVAAGDSAIPTPMVVTEHTHPLDDHSPAKKQWYVGEGACGFAWVVIRPGTSSFARWLKKKGYARKDYYGGMSIWISEHGQSITRKEAHADAMAAVFREANIEAHAGSRLD